MPEPTQAIQSSPRPTLTDAFSPNADLVTTLGAENLPPSDDLASQPENPSDVVETEETKVETAEPDTRFDKHPRFQELRTKAEQAETARVAAEALAAERESEAETLRQEYAADEPIRQAAKQAGFNSVSEYLSAVEDYNQSQAAEQRMAQELETKSQELQGRVDSGELPLELAQRMFQLEVNQARQEQFNRQQEAQSRQTTVSLNRQALTEITTSVPELATRKDLLGVLEKTLSNPSGGETIRTVGREMKAFGDAREQAGYDRAMAEIAGKKSTPAAPSLSEDVPAYSPPGERNPNHRYSLKEAFGLTSKR